MKAKDLRKNGFSVYGPPTFYEREPQPFFYSKKEISRIELEDEMDVPFEDGKKYFVSLSIDGGYYPGDETAKAYLVQYEEVSKENKKYLKELDAYFKKKEAHEQLVKDWKVWKKAFDAEEEIKRERQEKKNYLKLKAKYEKQ